MDISTFLLSKSYTDKKILEAIDLGFKVEVKSNRDILQTTGEDKILYLLPKINTDTKDEYDEYVYVNNDWEWIGHTVIDLSNYYTKTEIDNKGYLTQHQDISGKADKATTLSGYGITDAYTKTEIDNKGYLTQHQDISGKADKATTLSGYGITDAYTKTEIDNKGYLTQHQDISGKADKATTLAGYGIIDAQSKIDNNNKLSSDLVDDTNNTNKFVSTNEKSTWNAKYDKPSGGIPSTDLASAVQTSLGKADTALQSHQDISGKADKSTTLSGYGITDAYTKTEIDNKGYLTQHQDISGKEDTSNKVVSISAQSTDDQYPTAKCVYDLIGNIETLLQGV